MSEILISKVLPKYRLCSVCRSDNNVKEISFRHDIDGVGQGSIVALCEDCQKKLAVLLKQNSKEDVKENSIDDTISRREVIRKFLVNDEGKRIPDVDVDNFPTTIAISDVRKILKEMPPANKEKGYWIEYTYEENREKAFLGWAKCSVCGNDNNGHVYTNFCSNCGADMRGLN